MGVDHDLAVRVQLEQQEAVEVQALCDSCKLNYYCLAQSPGWEAAMAQRNSQMLDDFWLGAAQSWAPLLP